MIFTNEVAQIIASQAVELCNLRNQLAEVTETKDFFYSEYEKLKKETLKLEKKYDF